MHVHLDDAGVGSHADHAEARIGRRRVALDVHLYALRPGRRLRRGDKVEIVVDLLHRRHEDRQASVLRLDRHRRANGTADVAEVLLHPLLRRSRLGEVGHHLRPPLLPRRLGKCAQWLGRIGIVDVGILRRRDVGQSAEGQTIAHGAVAGHQKDVLAPQTPLLAPPAPAGLVLGLPALHRQDVARRCRQAPIEDRGDAVPRLRIVQFAVLWRDVLGQLRLLQQPLAGILIGRHDIFAVEAELVRDPEHKLLRLRRRRLALGRLRSNQALVLPDRHTVTPPVEAEGPARQRLARVPFSLAEVQEPAGCETVSKAADQSVGDLALLRTHGCRIPLLALEVVDRDECRLAAHRQPHVTIAQRLVNLLSQRIERPPRILVERLGDAGVLRHPVDAHVEGEVDLGEARHAADRRRVAVMRCRGQRNMALARQQAACRVEADPACAGQIDLAPGVQVREVVVRARRTIERNEVGLELDQISRAEARGETEVPQRLAQKPRRIAAGSLRVAERLLGRLHAGLHADDVCDLVRQTRIQLHQHVDGSARSPVDAGKPGGEEWPRRLGPPVDRQILLEFRRIFERPCLRPLLDEEVERVVDRHVRDEIDLDAEFRDRLGKDEAAQPVAVGVLLVVCEVAGRCDLEAVAHHTCPAVRCGAQADDLRSERHRPIVAVVRQVVDRGEDRHRCTRPFVPPCIEHIRHRTTTGFFSTAHANAARGKGIPLVEFYCEMPRSRSPARPMKSGLVRRCLGKGHNVHSTASSSTPNATRPDGDEEEQARRATRRHQDRPRRYLMSFPAANSWMDIQPRENEGWHPKFGVCRPDFVCSVCAVFGNSRAW